MKILHVLELISPDSAFGGPMRVAFNDASVLTALGHDVTVIAGNTAYDPPPESIGGVPVKLFPARTAVPWVGYAGTYAPAMRRWIAANASRFDVAHVHFGRDLVTIPAARQLCRARVPLVLQTHGMITPSSHPLAGPVDRLWTISLLNRAACVLFLNERERDDLRAVGGPGLSLIRMDNGVRVIGEDVIPHTADREAVPEVLFMARLHERKRAEIFAEAALQLLRPDATARFRIVGPPEGGEAAVDSVIERARREGVTAEQLRREPAVPQDQALKRMSHAAVYVLPAAREPFGMTIIEALSLGIPVVICQDGGLAPFVERHQCGLVTDATPESIASAIRKLLSDSGLAHEMGQRGRAAVKAELSIDQIGRRLEAVYRTLLAERGGTANGHGR